MPGPIVPTASPSSRTTGANPVSGSTTLDGAAPADAGSAIPEVSTDLYRVVVEFAASMPSAVATAALIFTDAGVVLLGLLMVLRWWRARAEDARGAGMAVAAPIVTVLAYVLSESVKSLIEQGRPCRAVPGTTSLAECPPVGDWSFPSNHATIAAAAATAVFLSRRARADTETRRWVAPLALWVGGLVAFSRVFVGVHYPHDVLTGLVLGAAIVTIALTLSAGWVTTVVEHLRENATACLLLGSGPSAPADLSATDHSPEPAPGPPREPAGTELTDGRTPPPETATRPIPRVPHSSSEDAGVRSPAPGHETTARRSPPSRSPRPPHSPRSGTGR